MRGEQSSEPGGSTLSARQQQAPASSHSSWWRSQAELRAEWPAGRPASWRHPAARRRWRGGPSMIMNIAVEVGVQIFAKVATCLPWARLGGSGREMEAPPMGLVSLCGGGGGGERTFLPPWPINQPVERRLSRASPGTDYSRAEWAAPASALEGGRAGGRGLSASQVGDN